MSLGQVLNKKTLPAALLLGAAAGFAVFVLRANAAVDERIERGAERAVAPVEQRNDQEHAQFRERIERLEKAAEDSAATRRDVRCLRRALIDKRPCRDE